MREVQPFNKVTRPDAFKVLKANLLDWSMCSLAQAKTQEEHDRILHHIEVNYPEKYKVMTEMSSWSREFVDKIFDSTLNKNE